MISAPSPRRRDNIKAQCVIDPTTTRLQARFTAAGTTRDTNTDGLESGTRRLQICGSPGGAKDYQGHYVREFMTREPALLVREPIPLRDAQARHAVCPYCSGIKDALSLEDPGSRSHEVDSGERQHLIQWALASIITGERAVCMGLATPDYVCDDLKAAKCQRLRRGDKIR